MAIKVKNRVSIVININAAIPLGTMGPESPANHTVLLLWSLMWFIFILL